MTCTAAVMSAVLPANPKLGTPAAGDADLGSFLAAFARAAPPLLRFGFWCAVLLLYWMPLFQFGRTLPHVPPDRRDRWLQALAGSRWFVLRQLVLVVKLVCCFAVFRQPAVRANFGGVRP